LGKMEEKMKRTIFLMIISSFAIGACALAPVETDPQKRQARWDAMRQDCYANGGVWNDNNHSCQGRDRKY